jgi:hypothetical protein
MTRHKLPKADLLNYARDGARTYRAINYEVLLDVEIETVEKDIAEIERRIKLVEIAERKKS